MQESTTVSTVDAKGPRRARALASLGFMILFAAFFLPQVRGCDSRIIPSHELIRGDWEFLLLYCLPFLFAFIVGIYYGLFLLVRRVSTIKGIALAICIFCIVLMAFGFVQWLIHGGANPRDTEEWTMFFLICLLPIQVVLGVVALFKAPAVLKRPICVFFMGISSLIYFVYIVCIMEGGLYGIWISTAGSLLIACGALWETVVLRRLSKPIG